MGSFLIIVVVHFMRPTAVVALVVLHLPVAVSALTLMSAPAWVSLPRTAVAPGMRLGGGHARRRPRPTVVGLVGGIASGKSTVSRALAAECGLEVIDADKLGHESYQPGTRCFGKLVDAFGAKIVAGDGTIDRRALGQAVSIAMVHMYVWHAHHVFSNRCLLPDLRAVTLTVGVFVTVYMCRLPMCCVYRVP